MSTASTRMPRYFSNNADRPPIRRSPSRSRRDSGSCGRASRPPPSPAHEAQDLLLHVRRDLLVTAVLHVAPVDPECRQPLLRVPGQHRRQIHRPRPLGPVEPPAPPSASAGPCPSSRCHNTSRASPSAKRRRSPSGTSPRLPPHAADRRVGAITTAPACRSDSAGCR